MASQSCILCPEFHFKTAITQLTSVFRESGLVHGNNLISETLPNKDEKYPIAYL